MKQWVTLMDGLDALRLEEVPEPVELREGEVLVKISHVSLNYRDIKLISGDFRGRYATPPSPIVPCSDASGTVVRTGGGGSAGPWKAGDRVISLVRPTHRTGPTRAEHIASGLGVPQPGVLAEYRVFPASGLVAAPPYLDLEEACTLPLAPLTAWMALNWDRPVGEPREGRKWTVVMQGTGGVSVAALEQARALDLTSIVTSSSDEKLARAKVLGATHTINYETTPDWATEVLRLTGGQGADVIVETGGPGTMEQSLRAVAEGGNISAVGILTGSTSTAAAGEDGQTPSVGLQLINRNATLKGINIGPSDRMKEMLQTYERKEIRPVVGRTFGFGEVREAFEFMRRGEHFGKVVIKVS